jgi:hypothetical protein
LAATGATVTLAAAPIDAAWHAAFGRDAVLWSPPHLLGVVGTLALIVGPVAGTRPGTRPWLPAAAGALLVGSAVVPVLEFETDVPQFSETLYLPVLLAGTLFAAAMLRLVVPGPLPVVRAVGIYLLLRLAITIGLAALGRSTPTCRWRSWGWPPSTCHGRRRASATPRARPGWRSPPGLPAPSAWPASPPGRWPW